MVNILCRGPHRKACDGTKKANYGKIRHYRPIRGLDRKVGDEMYNKKYMSQKTMSQKTMKK